MSERKVGFVEIAKIRDFKYNIEKAREAFGYMSMGKKMKPVHLQLMEDNTFVLKRGAAILAARMMMGNLYIEAKYSNKPSMYKKSK